MNLQPRKQRLNHATVQSKSCVCDCWWKRRIATYVSCKLRMNMIFEHLMLQALNDSNCKWERETNTGWKASNAWISKQTMLDALFCNATKRLVVQWAPNARKRYTKHKPVQSWSSAVATHTSLNANGLRLWVSTAKNAKTEHRRVLDEHRLATDFDQDQINLMSLSIPCTFHLCYSPLHSFEQITTECRWRPLCKRASSWSNSSIRSNQKALEWMASEKW